jgi:hypothetical protein
MSNNKPWINTLAMDKIDILTYDFELTKSVWLCKITQEIIGENSQHKRKMI